MRWLGYKGPEDQWEVEMQKASKTGLCSLIDRLLFLNGVSREERLRLAKYARREGRSIDGLMRLRRYETDPKGETERFFRRSKAARTSARRRKKAQR